MSENSLRERQVRWEAQCPAALTSDVLWKLDTYRAALFLGFLAAGDAATPNVVGAGAACSQLRQAAGSVGANLAEGYSRSSRADRLRFFGYALGSARECSAWYLTLRGPLDDETINERIALLARIRALLLGLIRHTRSRKGTPIFER